MTKQFILKTQSPEVLSDSKEPMNGWQRIGTTVAVIWILIVCSYASYERWSLPIQISGEVSQISSEAYDIEKKLWFISIQGESRDVKGFLAQWDNVTKASPGVERQLAIDAFNHAKALVYTTSLRDTFWLFLTIPILATWLLIYLILFILKWIKDGFKRK